MRTRRFAFAPCLEILSSRIAPSTVAPTDPDSAPAPADYSAPDPSDPSQADGSDPSQADSSDASSDGGPTPDDFDYDPYCAVTYNTAYNYYGSDCGSGGY